MNIEEFVRKTLRKISAAVVAVEDTNKTTTDNHPLIRKTIMEISK